MSRLRTPDTPDYPRQRRWGSGAGAGAHPPSSSSPPASSVAISPSARRAVSPLRDVGSPSWSSPERLSQRTHTASVRSLEGQVAALNRVIEDRPADTLHVTHDMQGEGLVELRNELLRDPGLPQLTGENAHACRGVRTGITRIVSAQLARWADAWEDNHNYQRMHAVFQKQMDETLAAEHARWEQNAAAMIRDQIEAANLGFRGELARVDRRVEDVMQSIAHSDNEAEARTAALWSAIDELRNKAKGNDAVQYAKDTAHTLQSQLENLAADVSDRMAKLHNEAQQIKQQVNRGDSSRDMQWVKTEMQRLEDDVNSQGDALSHLQKDVSDSKQRDSAVQKHMQWVKAEMQRLDGDMHSQGDALADLQNDVSDSKQRDSAVQKTMQAMQEDLHRLAREVRESTASAEAATAAVQDMEVELRELAKHLQHLLKQSKRPQPDGDVRRIKAELERDSAEMEAAVGEVRDTMKQLEQRVAVLERGAKDMPGRAVVKALQQNVDSLDGSTKRRMDQLEQLIRDLRDTTSAHDVRLRTLESTAREVDELRALLHNLEAARSNSPTTPPEDTAAASRKLSAMRAELDKVRSDVNGCMVCEPNEVITPSPPLRHILILSKIMDVHWNGRSIRLQRTLCRYAALFRLETDTILPDPTKKQPPLFTE